MIDFSKPVQTKSGLTATVLADDISGPFPIVARVAYGDGTVGVRTYQADGRCSPHGESCYDLINVPETRRVRGWVNMFADGYGGFIVNKNKDDGYGGFIVHETREKADSVGKKRIACVPVDIEYTVGDGL